MIKKSLPGRFYKYISWKKLKSRRILLQNCIHFSSPKAFNDPFDCSLSIRYDEQTPEEILENYKISLRGLYPEYDAQQINGLAEEIRSDNPDLYPKISRDTLEQNRVTIYKNAGIFSVSEIGDNILMWSHYCDSHRGICIGFDAYKLFMFLTGHFGVGPPAIACAPIKYRSKYPVIKPGWPNEKIGTTILTTKAKYWHSEKEWRFILWGETDIEVSLPEGIIIEVIVGCRMPKNHKDEIIEFLRAKESKMELKEAYPDPGEFKLDLKPISY